MRRTLIPAVVMVAAVLMSQAAFARDALEVPERHLMTSFDRPDTMETVWSDDMESGAPGWTTGDDSAQTHFWHIDSYMAYSGNSWWCGTFNYDADGGYGNLWTQYLTSPDVDWTSYTYPVLRFYFRNDTEVGYDFSFAQAESGRAFVDLNRGYDGPMAWGQAGFYLGNKNNPAKIRFAVYSDAAWSDADGQYLSVGGAFAVDDVEIYDTITSTVLFTDDADANVFLTTSVPAASGNYWSIRDNLCQAYSPTHYWGVSSPDTQSVPPNLNNWLMTPVVDISSFQWVEGCTLWFIHQMFMSGEYGGSWQEWGTPDAGSTWTRTGWFYGHQCQFTTPGEACNHYLGFIPIIFPGGPTGTQVAGKWIMLTDVAGNGCDLAGCTAFGYCSSGITIDDTWIEVSYNTPVQRSSWGRIKSLYR